MQRSGELVASLGMYDFPWTAQAHDALWQGVRSRLEAAGVAAPACLTSGVDLHGLWMDPALIVGHTCGYPYVTALREHVALVATPIYDFPGCMGAANCSFVVANVADARNDLPAFRGARALINNPDSNSGMNRFRAIIAPIAGGKPFFSEVAISGSHAASLEAIAAGRADIACIDCVSFALVRRGRPEMMANIGVVASAPMTKGLPLVMSNALAATYLEPMRRALAEVIADPALAPARDCLGLSGIQLLAPADYDDIAELERRAIALEYPVLA